jgi:general secretion pathway protein L
MGDFMSRQRLGLCIGKASVSAVLVKFGLRDHEVIDWAHFPFGEAETDSLSAVLGRIAEIMDLHGVPCSVSIPASEFSFRNIQIPFSDEKKIRQVLPYELEPTLPGPVDRMVIDYQLTATGAENRLLAAAMDRDRLVFYLAKLEEAGMDAEVVTPGGWCVARRLSQSDAKESVDLLLHGEADEAVLFGFGRGRTRLARPVDRSPGRVAPDPLLAQKVRQVINALELSDEPDAPVHRMLITSAENIDPGSMEAAWAPFGLNAHSWNPAQGVQFPTGHAGDGDLSPVILADAYALALTPGETAASLNLRRGPFRFAPTRARRKRRLAGSAMLMAVLMASLLGNLAVENYRMTQSARRLDQRIETVFRETFPDVTRVVDPLHQMRQKVAAATKLSGGTAGTTTGHRVTEIMDHISRRIPSSMDVELTRLVYTSVQLSLSGNTDSYNTVNQMKTGMEGDTLFSKVKIAAATVDKKDGKIQFTLKVGLGE